MTATVDTTKSAPTEIAENKPPKGNAASVALAVLA